MPKKIDYAGKKFNHLVLLNYSRKGGPHVGAIWTARCDCGTVREVIAKEVRHGKLKTCGNCEYTRKLIKDGNKENKRNYKDGNWKFRKKYSGYVLGANNRNLQWDLTPEQFKQLVTSNCGYCNAPAVNKYNGVDRVDNAKGYTLDNCAPCCWTCNRWKGSSKLEEFLEHVIKIAQWTLRPTSNT